MLMGGSLVGGAVPRFLARGIVVSDSRSDLIRGLQRELRSSNPHKDVDAIVGELQRLGAAPAEVAHTSRAVKRKATRSRADLETR